MVSALDLYKSMLKDHLAPVLRARGWKGSGRSFSLPSDTHWVLIGFQGSVANTASAVRFTVNWSVVHRKVWAEQWRKAGMPADYREWTEQLPTPTASTNARRIGGVLPQGGDVWWKIERREDVDGVAAEVSVALVEYLLPAISAEIAKGAGREPHG